MMTCSKNSIVAFLAIALSLSLPASRAFAQAPTVCTGGVIAPQGPNTPIGPGVVQPDLIVTGACTVNASDNPYYFGAVNIYAGGSLTFVEPAANAAASTTNFWAGSIIVENKSALAAGTAAAPYGATGATLTITLYGPDQIARDPLHKNGQGAVCKSDKNGDAPCGIPQAAWDTNGSDPTLVLPGGVTDRFYQYGPTYSDAAQNSAGDVGYFGSKVLGVSYGGTLALRGFKGTSGAAQADADPTNPGTSWGRLASPLAGGTDSSLTMDRPVGGDWRKGDWIVVTSTDFLVRHSERVQISEDPVGNVVKFAAGSVKWKHVGTRFPLANRLGQSGSDPAGPGGRLIQAGMDIDLIKAGGETRAAVALLTRSIQIVSGGDFAGDTFDAATTRAGASNYYYGGQTIYRQGFQQVQIQGVEFRQLGQGGVIGHYPVHFHMARKTPSDTYVKDSSVNESMTRWYVVHSTLGVLLARNVGYLSIGHGYYLEDGTETDNRFYANIGIYARAAVVGPDNPRNVPGILSANVGGPTQIFPQTSDVNNPSTFWIMNGWNEFVGNMAAGTGSCGTCFWLVPGINSDMVETDGHGGPGMGKMIWSGYSAIQANLGGSSPLKSFYKNYCSSSANSLTTVGSASACNGVYGSVNPNPAYIGAVPSFAPDNGVPNYYPQTTGQRTPTVCDPVVADTDPTSCVYAVAHGTYCTNADPKNCAITLIDHYTTSFNWAQTNFSAIWLRGGWNMIDNSFISDTQNGGLTIVSGGDYTRSSAAEGFWGLASRSVFVGETDPGNPYAGDRGPFNIASELACVSDGAACRNLDLSVVFPIDNFAVNQRLLNIYDGPAYEESNAFLDIKMSPCASFADCMYRDNVIGVRANSSLPPNNPNYAFLPNAAIGWKQPNGFYYAPAFHSANLYFGNVDIRHYVIEPLTYPGTFRTDQAQRAANYTATTTSSMFDNFSDVDRQTVLNDDDGSLTGLSKTISVNEDQFFNAPSETSECLSNLGVTAVNVCAGKPTTLPSAKTSPYDYVTTVVYPGCAVDAPPGEDNSKPPVLNFDKACGSAVGPPVQVGPRYSHLLGRGGEWSKDCTAPFCFGVPLYRQYLTGALAPATKEWAQWLAAGCDNPAASSPSYVDYIGNFSASAAKCQFPFARMSGTATFSRMVLTANHGTYYLDTTVTAETQAVSTFASTGDTDSTAYIDCKKRVSGPCQPLAVNAFTGGSTYYVFFIFAKNTTKQVYQIYVGDNFNLTDVHGASMNINTAQLTNTSPKTAPLPPGWTATMVKGADGTMGILQVTVDFAKVPNLDPQAATSGLCRPTGFCGLVGQACGCTLAKNDPKLLANPNLQKICESTCTSPTVSAPLNRGWATKALDCPTQGCVGFSFKLPPSFTAKGIYQRPQPTLYPTTPDWSVPFVNALTQPDQAGPGKPTGKGACAYASLPGAAGCPNPP